MKRKFKRCRLWLEELEPRTPLAADFVAGYLQPSDFHIGQISAAIRDVVQDSGPGSIEPNAVDAKIELNSGSPNGLPDGLYYLHDAMYLRIHLVDSDQVPLNSGRHFRLIISFDPEMIDPEGGIEFAGDVRCEWQSEMTDNELTIYMEPNGIDSLTFEVPFQIQRIGSSALSVALLHWDADGSVGTSEVALKASAEFSVKDDPETTGSIPLDRPAEDRAVFDASSFGRGNFAVRATGLLSVRSMAPRASIAKSLEDALPLSLASEKQLPNSATESTIQIIRRPTPTRSSADWGLLEDATANLFRPLELHQFNGQVDVHDEIDRRVTRLAGARDRAERDATPNRQPTISSTASAVWSQLARPQFLPRVAALPGQSDQSRDPLTLRLITADEIDAVFAAAWRSQPTPREEQP